MIKLLVVEDDAGLRRQYQWSFGDEVEVLFACDRVEATTIAKEQRPNVVLLDLGLPPDPDNATEGLRFLSEIKVAMPTTKVIVLTGSSLREHALQAIELGAWDFQQKGIDIDLLKSMISRAYEIHLLDEENRHATHTIHNSANLLGKSAAMIKSLKTLSKIAPLPITTLISGESGSGKELFAQNIHELSMRKGEFVAINCASIPADLLESELFGHEKGAFTGAHRKKVGKIERADGGTLFLDEIGDMPIDLQAKVLRFLQEKEIERIGGSTTVKVDVRVICATHRDLKAMSEVQEFRVDLFFRLTEFTLNVPPLRERDGDVILLAKYLLESYKQDFSSRVKGFSYDAINALLQHDFPGNIRELQNRIKTAVIVCESDLVSASDLELTVNEEGLAVPSSWIDDAEAPDLVLLEDVRKQADTSAVYSAYRKAKGNVSQAAKLLGVTRPTFYGLIDKYDMRFNKST